MYRLQQQFDSANILFDSALVNYQRIGDSLGQGYALGNIGLVYAEQGEYTLAQTYLDSATALLEPLGDFYPIAVYLTYTADIYEQTGRPAEAEKYLLESLEIATRLGLKEQIRDAARGLSDFYRRQGGLAQAMEYQDLYYSYRDSLYNAEIAQQNAEARASYEINLREVEKVALQRDKENLTYLAAAIGLGLLGIAFFAVSLNRSRNATKAANYDLRQQKALVDEKNVVITQKNVEITSSIAYASRIQRAMLPSQERLEQFFPEHVLFYQPRDIVSGDFYWMQEVQGKLIFTAADCTGHGVPGALMSMLGISILDDAVQERGLTAPNEILDYLNVEVYRRLQQETTTVSDGMDLALCCWDPAKRTLTFSGAKNPLLVLTAEGEQHYLKGDRLFIGGRASQRGGNFTAHSLTLPEGSMLYLYSDGYQDQFGGNPAQPKKFMSSKFRSYLFELAPLPAAEQEAQLAATFAQWQGEQEQVDDVLVLGIRV